MGKKKTDPQVVAHLKRHARTYWSLRLILMRSLPKSFPPILVALVLLLGGSARSQNPSPSEQDQTKSSRSAEQIPSPNPANTTVRNKQDHFSNHSERNEEKPVRVVVTSATVKKEFLDYAAPVFTLVFTAALVWVGCLQNRTLKVTNRLTIQTNKIYNAQRLIQRQQNVLTHRPRIRVRSVTMWRRLKVNEPIEVALSLANVGGTKALITASNFTVLVASIYAVPWRPPPDDDGRLMDTPEPYVPPFNFFEASIEKQILEAGYQTIPIMQSRHLPLKPDEFESVIGVRETVYAMGYIFYRDEVGQHHRTAFCRRLNYGTGRFVIVIDPDLEFED